MTRKASSRPAAPVPDSSRALRERAEKIIKDEPVPPLEALSGMAPHEMQRIIHELRVQQIEMEAQNEELQRQRAELVAAEASNAGLKESLRIKRLAFDLALNAISIANTEGIIIQANAAFLRIWGYPSKEEVIGNPILHFIRDPQDAAVIIATLEDAGCWEGSFAAKRKDGSSFIAYAQATVMRDELGQRIGYQSSVLDITERRQTEAALQASEARYREIFELAVDGILQGSPSGIIIGANSQMQTLAGRSKDELLGQHVSTLFDPNELAAAPLRFDLLNNERPLIIERNLLRPDGTRVPVEMHSKMMPDGTYQSIYRDIIERKRAEAALENSHSLLAETERLGKVGGWELDLETNQLTWTEETYRIFEVDLAFEPSVEVVIGFYAPSSRPVIERVVQRAIDHGEPFDEELEIITAKGNLRSVQALGKPDSDHRRVSGFVQDITERKRAEQTLSEYHEMFRAFMRNAPIRSYILAVSPTESRILHASDNYEQAFGKPMAEILGKTTADFFSPEVAARMHDADLQTMIGGVTIQTEQQVKDRTYHVIKFPIVLGSRVLVAGYTIDITERKQAERFLLEWNQTLELKVAEQTEELRHSEARLRQLAEITFEGIAISENGILVDGNAQLGKIHGYELAEMIGRSVMDFIAPESRAVVAETIRMDSEVIYECSSLRKDGSVIPIEAHGRMDTWQGKISRITALRDLSESKRLAARIQAQQTEIERIGRLAQISEISAAIIHQISQPISSLSINLAVATANAGACEMQRCGLPVILDLLQADVTRMREIVIHLRALAHPERPVRVRIDLNRVVTDLLPLLQREAGIHQIRLETALVPDLPPLLGDAVQLKQVILNLVRNGFDACAECPPPQRLVVITTRALPGQELELCVRDAGIGIAPANEARLFEMFFTTKHDGHGLGLRLCRTIVHAHDGSIEATNNPDDCGAVFRVLLPAES